MIILVEIIKYANLIYYINQGSYGKIYLVEKKYMRILNYPILQEKIIPKNTEKQMEKQPEIKIYAEIKNIKSYSTLLS